VTDLQRKVWTLAVLAVIAGLMIWAGLS